MTDMLDKSGKDYLNITREDLINLVKKIVECEGTEEEIDKMIEVVEKNVPYPEVSDLIYWNDEELTPEQIIDIALEYKISLYCGGKEV